MNHASGGYTDVGPRATEASNFGEARRNLMRLGLGLVLAWGIAGCHKDSTPSAAAMDQNAGDPANVNMASVSDGSGSAQAPPAQVLSQNVQYQPQQQGEDYGPQQQGAPIERRAPYAGDPNSADPNYYGQQADNLQAEDVYQSDLTDVQADDPPPPLPYYDQPPAPDPDYLWTPGYWAWGPGGYYWVPGCWVAAPYTGALWTPGYWGFVSGRYRFHHGFWGLHIGFYGGIDYGFGYTGHGYYGGYWDHDHFRYNTAVNHVDERVIRNVYVRNVVVNNVVVNNRIVNRVSYNGGRGGVNERPLAAEAAVLHEQRNAPMASQVQVQQEASQNRQQFYNQNRGRPAVVANARPVVADRSPSAALPRIAGPAAQPGVREELRQGQPQPAQQTSQGRQVQSNARGQVEAQPNVRQTQPEQRGLRQVQPQSESRQAQPQPETRGLRPAEPQARPQVGQVHPQSPERQAQPQPQVRQLEQQARPQEQARPQPQPRQQEQVRPQQAPAQRAQPQQRSQPPPQAAHTAPQNEDHGNDKNPKR